MGAPPGRQYYAYGTATGGGGTDEDYTDNVFTVTTTPGGTVIGRHIFYNQSYFDGNNPAANTADDNAIATDKQALLPGETATFANYTSYSRGINGIMVDIDGLADPLGLSAASFELRVGNTNFLTALKLIGAPTAQTRTLQSSDSERSHRRGPVRDGGTVSVQTPDARVPVGLGSVFRRREGLGGLQRGVCGRASPPTGETVAPNCVPNRQAGSHCTKNGNPLPTSPNAIKRSRTVSKPATHLASWPQYGLSLWQ